MNSGKRRVMNSKGASNRRTARRRLFLKITKFSEFGIFIFIVLLVIIVSLRSPYFFTLKNFNDILLDISILFIVATGQMLVILAKGLDLSVGAGVAFVGMVVALIVSNNWGIPPAVSIVIGMGCGLACGAFNGLIVSKGRVSPVITTLGTMSIFRGLAFVVSGGAWVDAVEMPESFKLIARGNILKIPNLIFFMILVFALFYYFLNYTKTGRYIYAAGSNPSACKIIGVSVEKITLLTYSISGMLFGLGGVLWVSRYASAQSDSAMGFEFVTIAACVIGGVNIAGGSGTLPGLFLGVLLLGIIINALNLVRISPFLKLAFQGLVILIAVITNVIVEKRVLNTILSK
jgi:rhamnose transport system permease protein